MHSFTQIRTHELCSEAHTANSTHTNTRTHFSGETDGTHTCSHRSSAATLPEAVHFYRWLCWNKAAVCRPSPEVEWDGVKAVNSSENAVKSASIKTGRPALVREEPIQ